MGIAACRPIACRATSGLPSGALAFELAESNSAWAFDLWHPICRPGENWKVQEFSSLREMATAMLPGFLAHHRDGPICLIGYSFAASLAIELAATLDRSWQVRSIGGDNRSRAAVYFLHAAFANQTLITYVGPWAIKRATMAVTDTSYRSLYYDKIVHRTSWYKTLPEDHRDYTKRILPPCGIIGFRGSIPQQQDSMFRSDHGAHPLRCY